MTNHYRWMFVPGMAVAAVLAATQALAQAPTDAQRSAIKSSCRSDYIAHCSSVPAGGAASVQCLQKNMTSLSAGCQTALRAIEPAAETKPAAEAMPAVETKPAAAPAPESKPATVETAKPASEPTNAAVQPAMPAAPSAKSAAASKPAPVKPSASAAAAPAAKPSEAQLAAIRGACRSDYPKVCSSVPPGGAAALQCLEQNKAKVSASCAKAVADVGGAVTSPANASSAGAAPTAVAGSPATAPAAPPLVLRPLRPLEELRIVRAACGADARMLCGGVEPGGGRVAQCLAANAASLSPACRGMLAQFAANR